MKLTFTKEFKKNYKRLPVNLQKKVDKQLGFLEKNFRHPSLRSRKMTGYKGVFEARVSKGYRMRYQVRGNEATMLTVGPRDIGLGKK